MWGLLSLYSLIKRVRVQPNLILFNFASLKCISRVFGVYVSSCRLLRTIASLLFVIIWIWRGFNNILLHHKILHNDDFGNCVENLFCALALFFFPTISSYSTLWYHGYWLLQISKCDLMNFKMMRYRWCIYQTLVWLIFSEIQWFC